MACETTARIVVLEADEEGLGVEAALGDWLASGGSRVTLVLRGGGDDEPASPRLVEAFEEFLRRAGQEGCCPAPGAVALPAAVGRPEELALEVAARCPGAPDLHLVLPPGALEAIQRGTRLGVAGGEEVDARRWWCGLVALAAVTPSVSLVPGLAGPGLSSLSSSRGWAGPTPGLAELVPRTPRRLRADLDFGALAAESGCGPADLARRAAQEVERADARLGPGPGPRRLALNLNGLGAAVVSRGLDPGAFATLRWLALRLRAFRDGARAASVALARRLGPAGGVAPFPVPRALEVADTGVLDRALLTHGARHSHLVCVSPWSLVPPDLDRRALGLLPALEWADSIAWRRPCGTTPASYATTLRFAWALARGR